MGTLTKRERDGLEDVFLSIHCSNQKYNKFKKISEIIFHKRFDLSSTKLYKRAQYRLKGSKTTSFLAHLSKKKKNLSK